MGEPFYSQIEADAMLAANKIAVYEAQAYAITGRVNPGFDSSEFAAESDGPDIEAKYKIIIQRNRDIGAYSITLAGSMINKPMQAICRYEVQASPHDHSECSHCQQAGVINPGVFHIHRYNYRAARDGYGWDRCAIVANVSLNDPQTLDLHRLLGIFITDMKLRFSDSQTVGEMFATVKP